MGCIDTERRKEMKNFLKELPIGRVVFLLGVALSLVYAFTGLKSVGDTAMFLIVGGALAWAFAD